MKKELINGVLFEVVTAPAAASDIVRSYDFFTTRYGCRDIFKAYNKPSSVKASIWNEWKSFADDIGGNITVLGASSNFFSVGIKTADAVYYITKNHNKVVKTAATTAAA